MASEYDLCNFSPLNFVLSDITQKMLYLTNTLFFLEKMSISLLIWFTFPYTPIFFVANIFDIFVANAFDIFVYSFFNHLSWKSFSQDSHLGSWLIIHFIIIQLLVPVLTLTKEALIFIQDPNHNPHHFLIKT